MTVHPFRLTLGVKVAGLVIFLIACLLVVAAFSYIQIARIGDEIERFVEGDLAITGVLVRVEKLSGERRELTDEIMSLVRQNRTEDSRAAGAQIAEKSIKIDGEMDAAESLLRPLSAHAPERYLALEGLIRQLRAEESDLTATSDRLTGLLLSGKLIEAATAYTAALDQAGRKGQTLTRLNAELNALNNQSTASVLSRQQVSATSTISVAVAALLLGVAVSYLIFHRLTSSVRNIAQRARQIALVVGAEDFKHSNVPVSSSDEIGDLTVAFNEMSIALERNAAEKQRHARELAVARDRALAASQAKTDFLATVSHELRTPLGAIIGYSEMLQEDAEANGQSSALPDLRRINLSAGHLLGLINDLLDLSKIEAGRMEVAIEDFSIAGLMDEVAHEIGPLVEKNANRFQMSAPEGVGAMRADRAKVRQTLLNLLSNAAKFTSNGFVRLSVTATGGPGAERVVFSVSDNGLGMSPDQVKRIFQEFIQADPKIARQYGGTGLGLSISRRFCRLMGGDITVETALGQGSTFTVKLPRDVEPYVSTEVVVRGSG